MNWEYIGEKGGFFIYQRGDQYRLEFDECWRLPSFVGTGTWEECMEAAQDFNEKLEKTLEIWR